MREAQNWGPGTTQWAAQFLVASELVRRGYRVAFTMGNHTADADLMVHSPSTNSTFLVDVKGQKGSSGWLVRRKASNDRLFYILVRLAPQNDGGTERGVDKFYVMNQEETNGLIDKFRADHPGKGGTTQGFGYRYPQRFLNGWSTLPQ